MRFLAFFFATSVLLVAPAKACQSVQVQYAHTADKPSRLADVEPQLTEVVSNAQRWFGRETDGRLTISYALPIREVQLRESDSYRVGGGIWAPKMHADLRGPCHTLTFVDGLLPGDVAGQSEMVWEGFSETNPALSPFATQPLSAIVWLWARPLNEQTIPELYPRTAAHETLHILGAVAPYSPHGDGLAHCLDGKDLMCPQEGPCPATDNIGRLDCGQDDYFNENPAPGSYLATHWNVANSPYLTRCLPPICEAKQEAPPVVTTYATKKTRLRKARVLITRAYRPDKTSLISYAIIPRQKALLCISGSCFKRTSVEIASTTHVLVWLERGRRTSRPAYFEAR